MSYQPPAYQSPDLSATMLQMPPAWVAGPPPPMLPPPMPPTPGPKPNRPTVLIVILVVVLVLCIGLGAWLLLGRGKNDPAAGATVTATTTATATVTATATEAPTSSVPPNPLIATDPPVQQVMTDLVVNTMPTLPTDPIAVNDGGDSTDMPNLQNVADDVAAGNVDTIVANCWTQPAQEVRAVYSSPQMRGAILQALTTAPQLAQGGGEWDGTYVRVSAYWEELRSAYPCLDVTWTDNAPGLGSFTPAMAQWRITRILAVYDGRPVHAGDGNNYALLCDADCNGVWSPHSAGQDYSATGVTPILSATPAQWDRLRQLSQSHIAVEQLSNGYYRVRADDGSTDAVAYFTGSYNDFWLPFMLGEID